MIYKGFLIIAELKHNQKHYVKGQIYIRTRMLLR